MNGAQYLRDNVQKLKAYQPGEQPRNLDQVVKLNTNENPYEPCPEILKSLASLPERALRVYPDPLCVQLRESLAKTYQLEAEQILVGNGSDEILTMIVRSFLSEDLQMEVPDPTYVLYETLAEIQNVSVRKIKLNAQQSLSAADLKGAKGPLFFLANPNSPTGQMLDAQEVYQMAKDYSGVFVIDEAYADFSGQSCLEIAKSLDNVLVLKTFSKSMSLAGIRLGWVYGSRAMIEGLYKVKDSYNVNALSQHVALKALEHKAYFDQQIAKVCQTRERVQQELKTMPFEFLPSKANFIWVKPLFRSAGQLYEDLKAQNILVRYFADDQLNSYLRITVGSDAQMDRLLSALKGLIGG